MVKAFFVYEKKGAECEGGNHHSFCCCMLGLIDDAHALGEPNKFGFWISGFEDFVLRFRYWLQGNLAFDTGLGLQSRDGDVFVITGGLLKTIGGAEKVYPYFGGRVAITAQQEPADDILSLAGVLGAEFFAVKRFSLSGESALEINIDESDTSIGTRATLTVLFYLN